MKRLKAVLATSVLAAAAALASAPSAHADVGTIPISEVDASGNLVCVQDETVANLLAPETLIVPMCAGATTVRVTNDTLEPIVVTVQSGSRAASSETTIGVGYEVNIIVITLTLTVKVDVPSGL